MQIMTCNYQIDFKYNDHQPSKFNFRLKLYKFVNKTFKDKNNTSVSFNPLPDDKF